MTRIRATFSSLSNRNYRLYFAGHSVSTVGEWMHRVGQAWLVLELTDSGTWLGVTAALQHLPTLVIGPWGGLLADRFDKRRLLLWTHAVGGLLAFGLAILTATGRARLGVVLAFALAHGTTLALDYPARQSFVMDMVGPAHVTNAITLNSVVFNAARAVGPAIAGFLIATVGLASSFYANAASYLVVVVALLVLRTEELQPADPATRAPGQLREGVRYVLSTPVLAGTLLLMAVSGMFAYEWVVTLPLLARDVFGGGAEIFGLMFSAMGVGAVAGGLLGAGTLRPTVRALLGAACVFSVVLLVTAAAPAFTLALVGLVLLGASSIIFRALATALLQVRSAPHMRGRVMGLFAIAMNGTTPVGGPLVGWVAEVASARLAFALGGLTTGLTALIAAVYLRGRVRPEPIAS